MTEKKMFGDFQTPQGLAERVVATVDRRWGKPGVVVEPTSGLGTFLKASAKRWGNETYGVGYEINADHVRSAKRKLNGLSVRIFHRDFFSEDWSLNLSQLDSDRILILGNPPWVTNSELGLLGSNNLPQKRNAAGLNGMDARTGKSNFDIAEWMIIRMIEAAADRPAMIAMLIKTAVARKVLSHLWKTNTPFRKSAIFRIDAAKEFGVAVSACLFTCELGGKTPSNNCDVFPDLEAEEPEQRIGWECGHLIADLHARHATRHLEASRGGPGRPRWRSGIKHDAAKVMEFRRIAGELTNALGEAPKLESDYVYPLLKGSDVARDRQPTRWMLVPQRHTGEDTASIRVLARQTWAYLQRNRHALDRRKSSIYRNRPAFSVFGVGDYTFRPWKVAICGLYKSLEFRLVGPYKDRPVVFDDTVYFLAFHDETTARQAHDILTSDSAQTFFRSKVFWDNKRPVTAEILNRLDLEALGLPSPNLEVTCPNLFATTR